MSTKITKKKRYQKKDPIEHILLRPDMYVGSNRLRSITEYVAEPKADSYHIFQSEIITSPAILRIFIEPLSNAIDNVERSRKTLTPCTKIKVSINAKTGETSIWNDGDIVPIEMDEEEKCYNHTMIFGQLLTGSNYDDEEERILSGRNGLGIKLCNVFSTHFRVKGCDPKNNKIIVQEWSNNMRKTNGPVVKDTCLTKGYTEVTWTPDFIRFGLKNGYTQDIVRLYTRFVVDAAMLSKVDVYLNNEIVPINNLTEYAELYDTPTDEKLYIRTKTAEVLVTPAREFETVSFVNGVYTRLGGQHVDAWSEDLFRPIVNKFNGITKKSSNTLKKKTTPKINITDVKQFFRLFVVCTVVRPEFDGQDKNKLESPEIQAQVKQTHITTLTKWSVMDNIEEIIRAKEMVVLKKAERITKKTKVEGLDPANKAGTKDGYKCSLFICEGLSAKTYVVAGIDEGVYGLSGRDWFGVLPVTGKVLNVRNASATSIAANKVICNFIHALGVKHGIDYTIDSNYLKLNYGRVIIIADADVDGIHIEGLIMNVIHSLYPTLLERNEPFVVSMKTPIARVIKKRGYDTLFYDERRFNSWLGEQKNKAIVKYYKGLGTTKPEDVPDTFGRKMVEYENDKDAFANMQKAFHKKYTDARKDWLSDYNPENYKFSLDDVGESTSMTISNFINGELIKFSHADCARSIPNGIDGLKESQRKLLYAVKKRKLKYSGKSLKVAQLAGYTAEHSNYHHGEKNLFETIIGMANEFPGTNNIPILYRDGMFGTRLEGANDAADGRYIFTKMDALTELIYREEDEPLLTPVNDDGDLVQPKHYVPIIPMMLVNGCFAPETQIPLFSGGTKRADEIAIGDILIGDDGEPRTVQKLFQGEDTMYTIKQKIGESYTVNSQHVLTLKNMYSIDDKYVSKVKDTEIVEITVTDYLKLPQYVQKQLRGYKGEGANWSYRTVSIDPYIFGLWLGHGDSGGTRFTSINESLVHIWEKFATKNNMEVIRDKNYSHTYNYELIPKNTKKYKNNSYHPFRFLLNIYGVLDNKHIPDDYIYNNKKIRIALLTGLINADGNISDNGKEISFNKCLSKKHILDSIQLIARSLGFNTNIKLIIENNGNKKQHLYSLTIFGKGLEYIQHVIPDCKKSSIQQDTHQDFSTTPIEVVKKGKGLYYGWTVNNNQRFVLQDFTVTHNCTAGIGTGWSSTIPCFNPIDLIASIKVWLENDGEVLIENPDNTNNIVSILPELTPWYRGFKGDIERDTDSRFITYGIILEGKRGTVQVTELPIGMWTHKFKEFAEDLKSDKKIKKIQNYSTPKDVSFILTEENDFHCDLDTLKLHSYLYTSNMVMFNEQEQLRKYNNVDEVLENFCRVRYKYYVKRKNYQLKALEAELRFLGNKERFVKEVIDKKLSIMNEKESDIINKLTKRGYDENPKKDDNEAGGYDYLLRMQVRNFTADKVRQIKNDIVSTKQKLEDLRNTTEKEIWLQELDEFKTAYVKWLNDIENQVLKTKKTKKTK